jgi:hypothetical protein
MVGPQDQQTPPRQPAVTPGSYGGGDHNWTMHALNRIETSLSTLSQEVRTLDGKIATIDRNTTATSTSVAGMSHVNSHITETKVFMGKTDVRLEQINSDIVTKGQLAVWALGVVITSVGGIFATGFWLAEKYLLPIIDKLPPTN